MGQHNIIELNGKRYDAVTGAFLGKTSGGAMHKTANGRAVDGFIRTKPVASTAAKPVTAIVKPQTAKQTIKTSKKMDVARPNATLLKAHTPERPKTLMRRAVHKPTMSLKPAIKTQAPTELMAAPIKTIATPLEKKMSVKHVNPARLAHAKAVSKSQRVRRFSQAALQAPAARQAVAVPHVQQVARTMPATNTARPNAYLDLRRQQAQPTPRTHAQPLPAAPKPHQPADIFETAIAHAASHEQPAPKLRRKHAKLVNTLAGLGAFLIIGGFVAYLNVPNIELHVASLQAGFHAQIPGYKPTGYAMDGGVHAKNNTVAMRFTSGDSAYTVTQQQSDWDSQTLLDNYVAFAGGAHKTIQSRGRTIYIYNGTNAAWVNGGVRYDISGSASLTSDELVSLATSM